MFWLILFFTGASVLRAYYSSYPIVQVGIHTLLFLYIVGIFLTLKEYPDRYTLNKKQQINSIFFLVLFFILGIAFHEYTLLSAIFITLFHYTKYVVVILIAYTMGKESRRY